MIALLLCHVGVLSEPLLYLSLYFKQHRARYYELLQNVRDDGDWESWLGFFADAILDTARSAVGTAQGLSKMFAADRARIRDLGRVSGSALQVHRSLQERPLANVSRLCEITRLSPATVGRAIDALVGLGVVREITGRRRNRIFCYGGYLDLLNEGTADM